MLFGLVRFISAGLSSALLIQDGYDRETEMKSQTFYVWIFIRDPSIDEFYYWFLKKVSIWFWWLSLNLPINWIIFVGSYLLRPGQIGRPVTSGRARAQNPETCPILRARNSCLVNNKNILDLQVFNRIGKTIKKLQ